MIFYKLVVNHYFPYYRQKYIQIIYFFDSVKLRPEGNSLTVDENYSFSSGKRTRQRYFCRCVDTVIICSEIS